MNSEERREARRRRREAERAEKRAKRLEGCTFDAMLDLNVLYKAQKEAARGVAWKGSTQRYQINWLLNINRTKKDLEAGRDICRGFHEFDTIERGKTRHISSVHFSERVPQKAISQNILVPALAPTLIDRNTANMKGKGLDYALRAMKRDLERFYKKHGKDGYILLGDFSNFFGSIRHDVVKSMIDKNIDDERAKELAFRFIDSQNKDGRGIGLGLGSEPNQIEAVSMPSPVDHFVTECLDSEGYGRYMDDFYLLHEDKEYLQACLVVIKDRCAALGITINDRKTHIVKLTKCFTFLKKRISFGPTGKVVMRPCRESITHERRKLKKQGALVAEGSMTLEDAVTSFQSWRGSILHLDAYRTRKDMDALFKKLFSEEALRKDPPPGHIITLHFPLEAPLAGSPHFQDTKPLQGAFLMP